MVPPMNPIIMTGYDGMRGQGATEDGEARQNKWLISGCTPNTQKLQTELYPP